MRDEASERANRSVRIEPDDRHNRDLVANVHPPTWIESGSGRTLRHGRDRRRHRRSRLCRGGCGPRRACRAGRAPPDGRRLSEFRLRPVQGRRCAPPRPGTRPRRAHRSAHRSDRAAAIPAVRWSGCVLCAPRSVVTTAPSDFADSASTCFSAWPGSPATIAFPSTAPSFASGAPSSPPVHGRPSRRSPGWKPSPTGPTRRSSRSSRRLRAWPFSAPGRSAASWRRPSRAWARASR